MKKVLLFSLFLLFISCDEAKENPANPAIWNGKADTKWYTSNKSATEFTITTPEQLAGLAKLVNGGNDFYGKTVKLGADIMLNDTTDWQNWDKKAPKNEWKPIGTYISKIYERTPKFLRNHTGDALIFIFVPGFIQRALRLENTDFSFRGTFDGGGFAVSGAYINTLESHQGLFGNIKMHKKAELRNLGVRASYIKGWGSVGGLVGLNAGKVSGCYSSAWTAGEGVLGGLVGNNFSTHAIIINSYSTGTVTGQQGDVGGLVGINVSGVISYSYSTGAVAGNGMVGGLVGYSGGVVSSYYNVETSGQRDTVKGKPKTTDELKQQSTFAGWDFEKTWGIDEKVNDGYPYLRNMPWKTE